MTQELNPIVFEKSLQSLQFDLNQAEIANNDAEIVTLAKNLMLHGQELDIKKLNETASTIFDKTIERNFIQPPEYTSPTVLNQLWADSTKDPLEALEAWNHGRRASNTGIEYSLDEHGLPINPFFNYGIKGRGIIGLHGPNHAVDMAPCRVMLNANGELTLHVLGIIREDSHLPALCGGFTTFPKDLNGYYLNNKKAMYTSQTHEFFEELVSGSVQLLPQYSHGLEQEILAKFTNRENVENHALSDSCRKTIINQLTTQRKLQQIEFEDPQFFKNIYKTFTNAKECYAGPVLSSNRNTNTSWMETRLSWFMLDEEKWAEMKGDNKFHYDFIAGDDAQDVIWHEITPKLLEDSASHGALFCYILSSCLANINIHDPEITKPLKKQAQRILGCGGEMVAKPQSPVLSV